MELVNVAKVFIPTAVAFAIGIAITPALTHYLYAYKMARSATAANIDNIKSVPEFFKLGNESFVVKDEKIHKKIATIL